jgi:hypothetical protein
MWKMESERIMKTDLKYSIGIAEMCLYQLVKILDKQLPNDYLLPPLLCFTKSAAFILSAFLP